MKRLNPAVMERATFVLLSIFAALQCVSIAAANVFLALSVLSGVIYGVMDRDAVRQRVTERKGLFIALGVFWAAMLLSAVFSGDALRGLKTLLDHFVYRLSPLFIILLLLPKRKYIFWLLGFSMLSFGIDNVYAEYQGFDQYGRYKGIYGNWMTIAGFACIFFPMLFTALFNYKKQPRLALLSVPLLAFFSYILLYVATRGAWVALLIVFVVVAAFTVKADKKAVAIFLVACMGVFFYVQQNSVVSSRIETITSRTFGPNTERLLMWQSAAEMFKDHPAFGVGLGQYKDAYQKHYIKPEAREKYLTHSHNNFIQMLAENGIIGFIGFVTLLSYLFAYFYRRLKTPEGMYALTGFSVVLAIVIQGLTEYNFGNSAVMKCFWLVLAAHMVLSSGSALPEESKKK
jgi:O-antigen ligase